MNLPREVMEKIEQANREGRVTGLTTKACRHCGGSRTCSSVGGVSMPCALCCEPELPSMDEKALMWKIIALVEELGWSYYHTYDSRRSNPGYPDLHLWRMAGDPCCLSNRRPGRSLWIECKTEKGKLTGDQERVIGELRSAGCEVHIVRPGDWNAVLRILT